MLLLALAAPLALLALGLFLEPDPRGWGTHEQLGFRPCWPMTHWNVPCPGCGVTTAVALAAHGSPLESLRAQPFGLALLLTSLTGAGWAAFLHLRRQDLYVELHVLPWRRLATMLGTLLLLTWIYKLALVRGGLGD
ncbi:MAG: DUF2752 domain-containing protein [Planctomycetes bacterium]|nr:DUF2752 domain-containing protein [Planctomycetota bacterium]